jgi:hypothetical protein
MDDKSPASRTAVTRNVLLTFLLLSCVIAVIGAIVPLAQPRIPMNHMRAAHSAVQLIAAEQQYAARFSAAGFTCDLRQLGQAGVVDKVLASGEKAGYHYELHGCNTTANVAAFSLAALPIAQGRTGKFAFCANQEGVVWYAAGGSIDECFRARIRWTR